MHIICKRLKPYEFHFNELVKPSNQYFYRFYCVITRAKAVVINLMKFFRELGFRSQNVSFHFTNQCYKSKRFSELFDKFFLWNQLGTKMCCFIAKILQWYYIRKIFATKSTHFHVKSICTQSTLFDFTNFYHDITCCEKMLLQPIWRIFPWNQLGTKIMWSLISRILLQY